MTYKDALRRTTPSPAGYRTAVAYNAGRSFTAIQDPQERVSFTLKVTQRDGWESTVEIAEEMARWLDWQPLSPSPDLTAA